MQWYYADAQRVQYGPMSSSDLAAAFRSGKLKASQLVWRDGMADWKPFSQCAHEVGLSDSELFPGNETINLSTPQATMVITPAAPAAANPSAEYNPYSVPTASLSDAFDPSGTVVYAGFWRRFAAAIFDGVIIGVANQMVSMPFSMMVSPEQMIGSNGEPDWVQFSGVYGLLMVISLSITFFYHTLMESSSMQGSLGKQVVGIKVTDVDGRRITFGRAALRWVSTFLSYLSLYIGFIMAGFTERKQALHDMIAGTLVVDKHAFTAKSNLQKDELGGCALAIIICWAILIVGIISLVAFGVAMLGSMGSGW
jgi:uncharacterized RDD family membrane protein YckC